MERFHYIVKQKLQILNLFRTGQIVRMLQYFPNVTQKQIEEWAAKEDQMRALPLEKQETTYILHPGPQRKYRELYQYLYQVVKEGRLERKAVTIGYLQYLVELEEPSIR